MIEAGIVFVLFATVFVGSALRAQSAGDQLARAWAHYARLRDLRLAPVTTPSGDDALTLAGAIDDVAFDVRLRGGTRLRARALDAWPGSIAARRVLGANFERAFAADAIPFDDAEFDAHFLVTAADPELAHKVLAPWARRALRRLGVEELFYDDGIVELRVADWLTTPDRLDALIDLVVRLARGDRAWASYAEANGLRFVPAAPQAYAFPSLEGAVEGVGLRVEAVARESVHTQVTGRAPRPARGHARAQTSDGESPLVVEGDEATLREVLTDDVRRALARVPGAALAYDDGVVTVCWRGFETSRDVLDGAIAAVVAACRWRAVGLPYR